MGLWLTNLDFKAGFVDFCWVAGTWWRLGLWFFKSLVVAGGDFLNFFFLGFSGNETYTKKIFGL